MESRKPTFVPVARLLGASQSRPNLPRADLQARPAHSCSGHHDPFLSTKRRASDVYDGRLILHGSRSRKKRSATSTWTCRSNRFRLAFPLWSGPSSSTCGSRAFSSFPSIFVLRSASLTLGEACKLRVARIVSTRRRPTGVGSRGDPRTLSHRYLGDRSRYKTGDRSRLQSRSFRDGRSDGDRISRRLDGLGMGVTSTRHESGVVEGNRCTCGCTDRVLGTTEANTADHAGDQREEGRGHGSEDEPGMRLAGLAGGSGRDHKARVPCRIYKGAEERLVHSRLQVCLGSRGANRAHGDDWVLQRRELVPVGVNASRRYHLQRWFGHCPTRAVAEGLNGRFVFFLRQLLLQGGRDGFAFFQDVFR